MYFDYLRNNNGKLSRFWMSYIDLVDILLNMVRASREGHWELHLPAIEQMMPWCFAYDNVNYACYLPAYLSEMTHLEKTHPEAHEFLKSGGLSVQIGDQNPFGRVPVDQTCEETVNKDTQTAGGIKGFSPKVGAVSKYYIVSEFRSIFLKQLRDMFNLSKSNSEHTDLQKTRIARDEADVKSLITMLESNWINPFSAEQQYSVFCQPERLPPKRKRKTCWAQKLSRKRHTKNFVHSAWRQIRQSNFTRP